MSETNQAAYKNNSIENAIAAARSSSSTPVILNDRQKKERERRLKDILRNATYKYQNLQKEYKELSDQVIAIQKKIAFETNPTYKAALKAELAKVKIQKEKKYDQMLAQKRYIDDFAKKNNISLVPPTNNTTISDNPSGPVVTATSGQATFPYKYNAPLVKEAYFNVPGIQSKSLDLTTINFASYNDARKAWQNSLPGKGAIQMDATFTQGQIEGFNQKDSTVKLDTQMYGFRFLYNPKEVVMGWTTQGAVDPQFAPQDEALPISSGLMSSVVTFSLILNRIGDMNYIDSVGLTSRLKKENQSNNIRVPRGADPTLRDKIAGAELADVFPYPEKVLDQDLIDIWNKGTMYDIEYLFKVLNGPAATFKNNFGIETADRAYMRLAIVELHLGNNLRYRVRVSDLDVNHTIFNDRMVPIFSTVRLTCQRFIDAPVMADSSTTSSTLSAPPHDLGMRGGR